MDKQKAKRLLNQSYDPHPGQIKFHRARKDHRFRVISAGRRFGKDYMAFQEALKVGLKQKNSFVPVITPTSDQGLGIFRMAQGKIPTPFYGGPDGIKKTKKEIHLINGSIMRFISAESQQSFRGLGYNVTMLIIDEAAYVDKDVWVELRPILSDNSAPAVFISTPHQSNPRNWFYDFFLKGQECIQRTCPVCDGDGCDNCDDTGKVNEENPNYDPRWWSYQGSSYENTKPEGYLNEQEIKDMEEDLTSQDDVDREIYGKFTETSGAFFSVDAIEDAINYNRRKKDRVLPPVDGKDYYIGVDPARSRDYTGVIVMDEDLRVNYVKAFQGNWGAQINKIKNIWARYGGQAHAKLYIDATREENLVVNLKEKGVSGIRPVNFASKGVKADMYFLLQQLLADREIELPVHKTLRSQLVQMRSTAMSSGIKIEAAEGHDDLPDALALALKGAAQGRKKGSQIQVSVV